MGLLSIKREVFRNLFSKWLPANGWSVVYAIFIQYEHDINFTYWLAVNAGPWTNYFQMQYVVDCVQNQSESFSSSLSITYF